MPPKTFQHCIISAGDHLSLSFTNAGSTVSVRAILNGAAAVQIIGNGNIDKPTALVLRNWLDDYIKGKIPAPPENPLIGRPRYKPTPARPKKR